MFDCFASFVLLFFASLALAIFLLLLGASGKTDAGLIAVACLHTLFKAPICTAVYRICFDMVHAVFWGFEWVFRP